MVHWHLIPFSKFIGLVLLFILPNLLLLLVYFTKSISCVLLEWELFSFGGLEFSVPLLLDKVSLIFRRTVVLISLGVMLFRVRYMSGDKSLEYFIYIVMLFVLSINFLIFIPHLVFLLLGWDGLGLTSYLLVIYYQNNKSLAAGMITVMRNRIGDSLIILAICWTFCNRNWVASVGI